MVCVKESSTCVSVVRSVRARDGGGKKKRKRETSVAARVKKRPPHADTTESALGTNALVVRASSASWDAPSSPRSPSSTSPWGGPCPPPSRTRTRCSSRLAPRLRSRDRRAKDVGFSQRQRGMRGARRAEGGAGARGATACVLAGAAGGRERAASRARSGDTRGTGGTGRCAGFATGPALFSFAL